MSKDDEEYSELYQDKAHNKAREDDDKENSRSLERLLEQED